MSEELDSESLDDSAPLGEREAQASIPEEELEAAPEPAEHLGIRDIRKVKLPITAELGSCTMLVRDVLELRPGSVLPLRKQAGEMADLYVGGIPLAKGEVVVLGDILHVRIAEIYGVAEREEEGYVE